MAYFVKKKSARIISVVTPELSDGGDTDAISYFICDDGGDTNVMNYFIGVTLRV